MCVWEGGKEASGRMSRRLKTVGKNVHELNSLVSQLPRGNFLSCFWCMSLESTFGALTSITARRYEQCIAGKSLSL